MRSWIPLFALAACGEPPDVETVSRWSDTMYTTHTYTYTATGGTLVPTASFSTGTLDADLGNTSVHVDEIVGSLWASESYAQLTVLGEEDGAAMAILFFSGLDPSAAEPGTSFPVDPYAYPGTVALIACAGESAGYWEVDAPVEDGEVVVETVDDEIIEMRFRGRVGTEVIEGTFAAPSDPSVW